MFDPGALDPEVLDPEAVRDGAGFGAEVPVSALPEALVLAEAELALFTPPW